MGVDFPGVGTALNVCTVLAGSLVGIRVGHRLSARTRTAVTDCLGLITLLMAGLSAMAVQNRDLSAAVGTHAPVLIVLGSLLLGAIIGSALRVEDRLGSLAGVLLGSVVPTAPISALTATGGLMLVAIALRLLRIRQIPVGDLLPALVLAPVLTAIVSALR